MPQKKLLISTLEPSGDLHAAYLIREIKRISPDIKILGIGGEKMRAAGAEIIFDASNLGVVGIFEALPLLPALLRTRRIAKKFLDQEKPDALLCVDSQGFNLPLAAEARRRGIKTIYYIAPQEWLWGTAKGMKKVAATIDLIISIFEKEHEKYQAAGAHSVYFGHPLLDIVKTTMSRDEARKEFLGTTEGPVICLCPGSRTHEIKTFLPILLEAGRIIKEKTSGAPENGAHSPGATVKFIVPAATTKMAPRFSEYFPSDFRPTIVVGKTYDALACADLAICTSGTINLEASLLGTSNIMTYKLSTLTFWIGKYIFKIMQKLPYLSMPNLLLNAPVIPELIMRDANPQKIAEEALAILSDRPRQEKMKSAFVELRKRLGSPGVLEKAAKEVLRQLNIPKN